MKRRIYLNMLLLAVCSVVLTSVFLVFTFYGRFSAQLRRELHSKAVALERVLDLESDQAAYLGALHLSDAELRITLVDREGAVLYDNTADARRLENHSDREEIREALASGAGESLRVSETFGQETCYYAVRLRNGAVLRVAETMAGIFGLFAGILPQSVLIVGLIVLACLLIAHNLTRRIVEPINRFRFEENDDTYDELAPFVRAITAQKQQVTAVLNEVAHKSDVLEAISDSMKEGLILTDKNGDVMLANKSALSLLHMSGDMTGKNILEMTRVVPLLDHMQRALRGENSELVLPVEDKQYHVFFSGVDRGALLLFLDVTERARAEQMRRAFSANVSHELKTPLTTISGFAELMENGMVKPEDVAGAARKVRREAQRLLVLIKDIMRLSELDESSGPEDCEAFDLTAVVHEAAELLKAGADEAGLTLALPEAPCEIVANRCMVLEMLCNLMENAIKYNKPGGQVAVSVSRTGDKTQISVKDTGIGIESRHLDRIFERFYRVDKSRSKKVGGTGLGLSIVKHIALYHGGSVSARSEPGVGTEITVELP